MPVEPTAGDEPTVSVVVLADGPAFYAADALAGQALPFAGEYGQPMCLGVPGRIVAVSDDGATATLDLAGDARQVSLALLADDPPAIGDWVTVHTGFAMTRLTEAEAREALDAIETLSPLSADLEGVDRAVDLREPEPTGAA